MNIKGIVGTTLGVMLLASVPASALTLKIVGADTGHGLSRIGLTPVVWVGASQAVTADHPHQVPLPTEVPASGNVTISVNARAWAPVVSGSRPFQRVQGRILVWDEVGNLICATPLVVWSQTATPVNRFVGTCTFNPAFAFAEMEFLVGHTQTAPGSAMPRVYSVRYGY